MQYKSLYLFLWSEILKQIIMVKLIVNYSIQVWKNSGYQNQDLSLVIEFEGMDDVSNEAIDQILYEKHKYTFTVKSIQQIV